MTPDLHFALGRALEQCGKFRASLAHFDKANSADRLNYRKYVPTAIEAEFDAIKKTFNDEWFKQNRLSHSASPVFICGMFRSGSTLVEADFSSTFSIYSGRRARVFQQVGRD